MFPEPKERPLSAQAERACAATMGAGFAMLVASQVTEGQLSRQLLISSIACIVSVGPPICYQLIQGVRWVARLDS